MMKSWVDFLGFNFFLALMVKIFAFDHHLLLFYFSLLFLTGIFKKKILYYQPTFSIVSCLFFFFPMNQHSEGFILKADEIRQKVFLLLEMGSSYKAIKGENSALALTSRACKELLKVEPAMWLFVKVEGVEPTNNAAERAIRPAVLWRKNSFGTQSANGSVFVARIFTVVMTLRSQNKNILDFLVDSCQAFRNGNSAPSLLPDISLTQSNTQLSLAA